MIIKCFFLLCSLQAVSHAQLVTGTEFIIAFPETYGVTADVYLYVNNQNDATITLTISSALPTDLFNTTNVDVPAKTVQQVNFSDNAIAAVLIHQWSRIETKGVTVQSTRAITLYVAMNSIDKQFSTEYLVLPTNKLSTQYNYLTSLLNYNALLIANQDNTVITLGTTGQNVTLNKLQTYLIRTAIGSIKSIWASAPFASLLYGSESSPSAAVMSLPSTFSSTGYPLLFSDGNSGAINIFALYDNTWITLDTQPHIVLNAGESKLVYSKTTWLNASLPVQVIYDPQNTAHFGYALAPENYLSTAVQFRPLLNSEVILVMAPQQSVGKIAIDGQVIPALSFRRIPQTLFYYYFYSVPHPELSHTVGPTEDNQKYLAIVYNEQQWGSSYPVNFNMP